MEGSGGGLILMIEDTNYYVESGKADAALTYRE
jgi:hypothetical protein